MQTHCSKRCTNQLRGVRCSQALASPRRFVRRPYVADPRWVLAGPQAPESLYIRECRAGRTVHGTPLQRIRGLWSDCLQTPSSLLLPQYVATHIQFWTISNWWIPWRRKNPFSMKTLFTPLISLLWTQTSKKCIQHLFAHCGVSTLSTWTFGFVVNHLWGGAFLWAVPECSPAFTLCQAIPNPVTDPLVLVLYVSSSKFQL